jgi:hypothetical protein
MNVVYKHVHVSRAHARVCACVRVDEIGVWMTVVQKETSHGVMSLPLSPQEWNKFLVLELSLGQQIVVKIRTKICNSTIKKI